MQLPNRVIHADWSIHPPKRWLAQAVLQSNGRYEADAPKLVPPTVHWLPALKSENGTVLVGFDFPIGLPQAYAKQTGIDDFMTVLTQLGDGEWADFYRVAEKPQDIGLKRPFYPQRPGGTKQQYLLDGLSVSHINDLRRRCELPQTGRRSAAPLFWTMGAQQVGKAAIAGWQEVLTPALQMTDAAIWPFSGRLVDLLSTRRLVLAETYPAEFYTHLDITFPQNSGKRNQDAREANASTLFQWAAQNNVALTPALHKVIQDGFGSDSTGEDMFDAVVGLFGMLNLLRGKRPLTEPNERIVRQIEGWILGQAW